MLRGTEMSDLRMARLGGEGGITIPTDRGLLIANRRAVTEYAMDEIGDGLRERGVTLDEWIEPGREVRGRLVMECRMIGACAPIIRDPGKDRRSRGCVVPG